MEPINPTQVQAQSTPQGVITYLAFHTTEGRTMKCGARSSALPLRTMNPPAGGGKPDPRAKAWGEFVGSLSGKVCWAACFASERRGRCHYCVRQNCTTLPPLVVVLAVCRRSALQQGTVNL